MPRFALEGHALLSDAALDLNPDAFDAQAEVAERLLGIDSVDNVTVSSTEEPVVLSALARQVNLQVAIGDDVTSALIARERKGPHEIEYRGGSQGGDTLPVDPVAVKMLSGIATRGWPDARSVR